jgi:hypothetical protein
LSLALRVLLSVPVWLLRIGIFLPLAIVGIPLVYLLSRLHWCEPRYSKKFDRTVLQWRTRWLFGLYNNLEDGVDGLRGSDPAQLWWHEKTAAYSPQQRIFVWAAFRNPVDNLRFVPVLNPKLVPSKVRSIGMYHEPAKGEGGWYYAWLAGSPYSCIRYETKTRRFWLGWKIRPEDRNGLKPGDARAIRCDFAIQFKRIA